MEHKQRILYHQIHPAKLATDIGSAAISLYFFWEHDLILAAGLHFIPPLIASFLLVRYGNLEPCMNSAFGRYVGRNMTRTFEFLRLGGDLIMVYGAWFHRPQIIVVGLVIIVVAWGNGLLRLKHLKVK